MSRRAQVITHIFNNLSAMRRLMFQSASAPKSRVPGPTHAQLGAMFALSHEQALNVKALAKCFGMTSSAATQLINSLVARGWATRRAVAGDRRKVSLRLSPAGQRMLKTILAQRSAVFAKHLEALSDTELEQLQAIQNKILAPHRG